MVVASDTAAQVVNRGQIAMGSTGRRSNENHRPRCEAEAQSRPNRPRPAVCRSAKIDQPAFGALASPLHREFVGRAGFGKNHDLAHRSAGTKPRKQIIRDQPIR